MYASYFRLFPIARLVCKTYREVNKNLRVLNLVQDSIKETTDRQYDDQQKVNAVDWYNVLDLLRGYVIDKDDNCETTMPNTDFSCSQSPIADISTVAALRDTTTTTTLLYSTTLCPTITAVGPSIVPSPLPFESSKRPRTRYAGLSMDLPSFSENVQPNMVDLINGYQNLII